MATTTHTAHHNPAMHDPTMGEKPANGLNGVGSSHHHEANHGYNPAQTHHQHGGFGGHGLSHGHSVQGMPRHHEPRRLGNPAPLGLCAFALTTFVLSAINMEARSVEEPSVIVPLAFAYGGLVQLLAGMWEIAVGNTFGATALASYGGFWIAYGILLTPSPWAITQPTGPYQGNEDSAIGFFLTGWFIFTTILLLCTLRSSLAYFILFFTLDLAFLFLSCDHYAADMGNESASIGLKKAGGFFGFLAAFAAWYNALAGLQDSSNSFFTVPVFHFPWSDKGRELRGRGNANNAVA